MSTASWALLGIAFLLFDSLSFYRTMGIYYLLFIKPSPEKALTKVSLHAWLFAFFSVLGIVIIPAWIVYNKHKTGAWKLPPGKLEMLSDVIQNTPESTPLPSDQPDFTESK